MLTHSPLLLLLLCAFGMQNNDDFVKLVQNFAARYCAFEKAVSSETVSVLRESFQATDTGGCLVGVFSTHSRNAGCYSRTSTAELSHKLLQVTHTFWISLPAGAG
jgi:hypothetical protein